MSAHWQNQPREPIGLPIGGQWTEQALAGSGIALAADLAEPGGDLFAQRREALAAGGYVPAVATRAVASPLTTQKRDDWWDTHFVQAEYSDGAGYAKMPDDYTPSQSGGRALSGKRRTHRMAYSAGGVAVRMPSRTAIHRYSAENGNPTFDVPVSASLPDGDVQGWVRVTKVGPGSWETTGVGFPPGAEVGVAEAVGATLEGRAAAMRPQNFNDLIERRRQRLMERGFEMEEVDSSWISSFGYDPATGVMATMTTSGRLYGHKVPEETYEIVAGSRSPGALFNKLVKGNERAEVERCEGCGRFRAVAAPHSCPKGHKAPAPAVDPVSQAARERAAQVASGRRAPEVRPTPAPAPAKAGGEAGHVRAQGEQTIDLREVMKENEQSSYATPGVLGMYAPRGWTRDVAPEVLEPFTSSTYVPTSYTSASHGFPGTKNGHAGLVNFGGVGPTAAKQLLSKMPERALAVRQNDSPTARTMLTAAVKHPGKVELTGYVVGPERDDERITVDGVYLFDDDITDARGALFAARDKYGLSDATRRPGLVRQVEVPWRPGERAWQLEWD